MTVGRDNKIGLNDTLQEMVVKMADGNIGAATVLMKILKEDKEGVITILHMDDLHIYGEQIWMWYKDVLGENVHLLIDAAKSRKLRRLSYEEVNQMREERLDREQKDREALR